MRLLALEPYYSGSHRAFLDGWREHSRHRWTLLTLPGYKWKWRMRHGALTFAEEIISRTRNGERWDVVFATDMLDLAALLGLAGDALAGTPSILYFHENQFTYPVRQTEERDYHFAFTNFTSAACARRIWFNSDFHRREFLSEADRFLRRMPDYPPVRWLAELPGKSAVFPQGIEPPGARPARSNGPLRILWAARWEFDKNPDEFFAALEALRRRGVDFRVDVIGEQFENIPPVFESARRTLADCIDRWGFLPSRTDYWQCLSQADLIVSTARHEFFGVTVIEAAAAGAFPALPHRLAYPEIFPPELFADHYYHDSPDALAAKIETLAGRLAASGSVWLPDRHPISEAVRPFLWSNLAQKLDSAVLETVSDH